MRSAGLWKRRCISQSRLEDETRKEVAEEGKAAGLGRFDRPLPASVRH